jgi:hypothetical protein
MGLDRWPTIAAEVAEAPPCESVCLAPVATQRTLIVNGKHLTSAHNRTGEAETQALTIPKDATEAWVYGHALGDCVAQLLLRGQADGDTRRKLDKVHVVVMARSVTKVVAEFDKCTWMDSPRVELRLARDLDRVHTPFCVSPVELFHCDEDAEPLRDRLTILLNAEFNETNLQARRHVELAQYEENKPVIERDGFVNRYFQSLGPDTIVIGGGPSLSEQYDWIKERAQTHNIIAASTALWPLMRAGIVPDVVMVIDPAPDIAKHFRGLDLSPLKDSVLVYIPSTFPEVVRLWPGPRACATIVVGHPGDLFSGGTVAHSAMDLACKSGAQRVYMAGLDFSYPGNASHVDGARSPFLVSGQTQAWRETTTNGLGQRVTTSAEMVQYRRVAEDMIRERPEVKFYKLGKQGVPLAGAEWVE